MRIYYTNDVLAQFRDRMLAEKLVPAVFTREFRPGGNIYEGAYVIGIRVSGLKETIITLSYDMHQAYVELQLSKIEYIEI